MKKCIDKLSWITFILPLILFTSNVNANTSEEQEPNNIVVGSRALSDSERAQLVTERELSCEDGEECDIPNVKAKFSAFKEFYQLHYSAFHHMIAVAIDGSTIEIEDGSIWSLKYTSDMFSVLGWLARDSIVIEQYDYRGVEYKIINQNRDQYIIATPTLGPVYEGIHTHWVVSKDSFFGTIQLEDGSEWETFSSSNTARWQPDDTVVVGAYNWGGLYNTILININLLDYARVKLKWAK